MAFLCGLIPWAYRAIWPVQRWLRDASPLRYASPLRRAVTAIVLAAVSAPILYFIAARSGYLLRPHIHDEFSYRLQMRMLLSGRLWEPPHPLGDFFDAFYVLITPVYAS